MSRRLLLATAFAAAAALACNKGSSSTSFRMGQPTSVAVAWAYGHLHPDVLWPYAALANSERDELILFDAVEDRVVPAPILFRPLSIPVPDPRPALVASAQFTPPDSGDPAAPTPPRPSLLVVVSAGSTQLQLVRTWYDPTGKALNPGMTAEAVELGSQVLSMVAVPTVVDQARVVAALADGTLAVVDYQWTGSPTTPGVDNKITRVHPGDAPTTVDLKFQALSLAVDANPGNPAREPDANAQRFLYAATLDPIPPSNTFGIAQIDMSGDPASWTATVITTGTPTRPEGVPTRLVAAITLQERSVTGAGAYGQIVTPDGDQSAFEATAVRRVYAWPDPAACGLNTDLPCGILVLDPKTGNLAKPAFLGGENFPITLPSRPVAMLAAKPPANAISATPQLEVPNQYVGINAVTWRITTGVLAIPSEDGKVYWADLARWEVPSMELEVNGPPTATGVELYNPSAASSRRIGLWEPKQVADADQANGATGGRNLWLPTSGAAAYVLTTPGFTPADTWTITYQGYLPDFAASRLAEVEVVDAVAGRYRVALQARSPGSPTPTQFTNVFDGSHGVRVGDIVEFWTGPTRVVDEKIGTVCPDTTTNQGDGLPTSPIEGKVESVDPRDDKHPGGSLVVSMGDCVNALVNGKTVNDCAKHGPWTNKPGCWSELPNLPTGNTSGVGVIPVRIRAGGGAVNAEEFVVVGAATGYAGRATANSSVTTPVAAPTFTFTSESEAALTPLCTAGCATADCRSSCEQLAIARRARRTHLTSVACSRSSSSAARTYCETYFPQFKITDQNSFPVPKGPTLAFSIGLTCVSGDTACTTGQKTDRLLVRDTQASFITRSGWTPSARFGGGANGGQPTQPTGLASFDRSNPDWGKQEDRYRFFVPYVDNLVLDVTAAQTNGDTRVLR